MQLVRIGFDVEKAARALSGWGRGQYTRRRVGCTGFVCALDLFKTTAALALLLRHALVAMIGYAPGAATFAT